MAQTQITNILWMQNSPYGTFVVADYIDVYWDDSTNLFVVKKNGGVITSGPEMPVNFTYSGNNQFYYKAERIYQISMCQGTDFLKFVRIDQFPYYIMIPLVDHPSCSVGGEVCDLKFNTLPTVTDASTITATDGQIVVSAAGSNGSVKYNINSDFEYSTGGQTSGTFTSLGKGNYLIFARDAINCLAVISVNVGVDKTYGVLYQLEYYDIHTGGHHKTQILQKDYAGAIIEIIGGSSPTTYSGGFKADKDKFSPIFSADMAFNMMSVTEAQYQTFFTNDPEKFRMRHSIDSGSGYSVIWTAKVLPSQYEEAYKSAPYDITVRAHDGLATLQEIPFLDDDGNRLTGSYKQISIIAWILKKIGLGLNIRSGCNIYALEPAMATTAASDPLDQAYVDVYRYYLIDETPNCWDVLTYILEPYGAQIIQYYNVWNILRIDERVNSFDYRTFDSDGVYVSNSSYSPVKNLKGSGQSNRLVWTNQDQLLKINPGYGKIRLLYDMGLKSNLFINGDFAVRKYSYYAAPVIAGPNVSGFAGGLIQGTIADTTGFELINNEDIFNKSIETIEDSNVALVVSTFYARGGYILSDTLNLKMGNEDEIRFTINVKIVTEAIDTSVLYIKLKVKVIYGDYFLQDGGSWSLTDSNIVFFIKEDQLNKYQKFEIIADVPDPAYVTGENFNVKIYIPHAGDYDYSTLTPFRAKLTASLPAGYRLQYYDNASAYFAGGQLLYYELKNETHAESLPNIVEPDDYHVTTNPYKWILVAYNPISTALNHTYIDYVKFELLNKGKTLPKNAAYEKSMENENPSILNKLIYHGSLVTNGYATFDYGLSRVPKVGKFGDDNFTVNIFYSDTFQSSFNFTPGSPELSYSGYLRDSTGAGFTLWARDSRSESLSLQEIFLDMYLSQYNRPWRSLGGGFIGDIIFTPLDTLNETMDNDRKYFPAALDIDYKNNEYRSELSELTSVADADADENSAAEFNLDFNLDYNS